MEVKNLVKDFNGYLAVNDISFDIEPGEIVGLLGPNGAGKTTTIMMLLGLIKPTAGKITIFGLDLEKNRQEILSKVNFSSPYTGLFGNLTAFENLYVSACLYGLKNYKERIKELLAGFGIFDLKDKKVLNFSSGEYSRLGICRALLNNPELLFLDEPTASLDPEIAKKVREILLDIRKERNTSMLYTSHNMEEVTQMCDRVIFLNKGRIVAADTPLNLTKTIKECFLVIIFDAPEKTVRDFCSDRKLNFQILTKKTLKITLEEDKIGDVLTELPKAGIAITDITVEKPNLEDVFLKIANS